MNSSQFLTLIPCLVKDRKSVLLHPGGQVGQLCSLTELSDQEIFLAGEMLELTLLRVSSN